MRRNYETGAKSTKSIKVTLTLRDELADRMSSYARVKFPDRTMSYLIDWLLWAMFVPSADYVKGSWPQSEWTGLPLVGAFVMDEETERTQAKHDISCLSEGIKRHQAQIAELERLLKEARAVLAKGAPAKPTKPERLVLVR